MQVDEQGWAVRELGQRRRDAHRHRRRPDASLCSDEREHRSALDLHALTEQSRDRGVEFRLLQRLRDVFVDPGAHALEHQRRIERRREQDDIRRRMLPGEGGEIRRHLAVAADVDEQNVRLAGRGGQ